MNLFGYISQVNVFLIMKTHQKQTERYPQKLQSWSEYLDKNGV